MHFYKNSFLKGRHEVARDGLPETQTWDQRPKHEESAMKRSGKNLTGRENSR